MAQSYAKLLSPFGRANSISPSATNAGYWLTACERELKELLANKPSHKLVEPETVAKDLFFLHRMKQRISQFKTFLLLNN